MNEKEFLSVNKQSTNVRYEYFIKKVVDLEEVWGLYSDGWATSQDEEKKILLPLFPNREIAESCARKEWAGYSARSIPLGEFIDKWLTGMENDEIRPSIFPNEKDTAVVRIEVLRKDLERELENY
ncbi:DUF2750 domain-containing protein [Alkalihalobacillus sp. CinArs1]|uniref:DUF2750 domain-containing protein n=1 Tax=Alkalihalobacillus sp. CinArs1 TaxID=2995314 RepID=UPI0022DE4E84|nr:DUF2750 domain-containing protein [Alkalihalobacillus sp. CinArs1]